MKKKFLLCFLTLIFFIPALRAQDTITEITIKRIYISKHPQDPEYPQFVIYSKSNNFQLGFGGYAKLTGAFDFNGIVDNYDFITYDIPAENQNLCEKRLYFDAHQSRIYVEILGHINGKSMRIYIETDFYSEHYYPRLRHAYGQIGGFLFGQAWSTIMDLDAMPNTIDFEGPNSAVSLRAPMIRYTHKFGKWFTISSSLELPDVSMTYGKPFEETYQYIPDWILAMKFKTGFGHFQLGGVLRTMTYKAALQNKTNNILGYGIAVSGLIKITSKNHIMFQGVVGTGVAKYIQDISGAGLDAIRETYKYKPPDMQPLTAGGFYIGYQHFWIPQLNSTIIYGLTLLEDNYFLSDKQDYKKGQYVAGNLIWELLPNLHLGIEYLWGQRQNSGNSKAQANRINGMVQFSF